MLGFGSWDAAVEEADTSAASNKKKKGGGFQTMGLDKPLLDAILKKGFNVPTPVQRKAIPSLMLGNDVVAMARTGSGKTAAFLIPMLHLLKSHSKIVGIRGLILSPTRELSLQILRDGFVLNKYMDLRFTALVGGGSLEQQFQLLASNPDIVVATPGRLLHIMEETSLQLSAVRMLVLDEADRLFEMGFQPQIVSIMQKIPESAQRALFSATMPSVLAEFTTAGLHDPVVIRLDAEMKLSDKLKQSAFLVRNEERVAALIYILKRIIHVGEGTTITTTTTHTRSTNNIDQGYDKKKKKVNKKRNKHDSKENDVKTYHSAQALVFVESKFHVDYLRMILQHYMISCNAVHGQMDQEARKLAVQRFTKRETSVMVVTDVAARGLDIPLLDNVINFSFPFSAKLFVHRVGRVARAGRSGTAYSIMTYEDFPYYVELMHFLELPVQSRKPENDVLFTPDDKCYGRLPEEEIQLELDFLRRLHDNDVEVRAMASVVENAHRKYSRTKRKPSHEAIQEARRPEYAFDNTPIHPMLLDRLGSKRVAADAARFDLKKFKSKDSLLELMTGEKMFELRQPETIHSLSKQEKENAKMMKSSSSSAAAAVAGHTNEEEESEITATVGTTGNINNKNSDTVTGTTKKLSLAETMLLRAQARKEKRLRSDSDNDSKYEHNISSHTVVNGNSHMLQNEQMQERQGKKVKMQVDPYAVHDMTPHFATSDNEYNLMHVWENEPLLSSSHENRSSAGNFGSTGKYRDSEFFMPTEKLQLAQDAHYSVKDATLDLNAETAEEAAQQRLVYAWSKKKNRYVKMHVGDAKALLKGIKNEAGKLINHKTKLDNYLKWTKKSNLRIQDVGEEEDLVPLQRARDAANAFDDANTMNENDEGDGGEAGQQEIREEPKVKGKNNAINGKRSTSLSSSSSSRKKAKGIDENDEDYVDISNPNAGKKLRIGRKMRRLPKDGHVRTFEELAAIKRKAEKEKARLANKQQHKRGGKGRKKESKVNKKEK